MKSPNIIKDLGYSDVIQILEGGNFDKFLNASENETFEAKTPAPYDLEKNTSHAIAELSKDVTSIANSSEGIIVCGLNTLKNEDFGPHDIVSSVVTYPEGDFYNKEKIFSILKKNVYPAINVELKWFKSSKDKSLGLGAIIIKKQDENLKPFIVTHNIVEDKKLKSFFSIPIRKGSDPVFPSPDELHKLVQRKPSSLLEMYSGLSAQLNELKSLINPKKVDNNVRLKTLVKDIIQDHENS